MHSTYLRAQAARTVTHDIPLQWALWKLWFSSPGTTTLEALSISSRTPTVSLYVRSIGRLNLCFSADFSCMLQVQPMWKGGLLDSHLAFTASIFTLLAIQPMAATPLAIFSGTLCVSVYTFCLESSSFMQYYVLYDYGYCLICGMDAMFQIYLYFRSSFQPTEEVSWISYG